jgi:hypothetical protein
VRDREWLYAGGNVLLSVALCLIAVWLGYVLGAALSSTKEIEMPSRTKPSACIYLGSDRWEHQPLTKPSS